MFSRAKGFALAAAVAGVLGFQAHAGGFNFGSFMLGNGGSRWVPECKAPEKLTEGILSIGDFARIMPGMIKTARQFIREVASR